ncbi:tetratricopeptide repeat protein, partial [Mariniblastus sp.]|nr:tetratricopeptide repeat protein [Mariniblastus sp.]
MRLFVCLLLTCLASGSQVSFSARTLCAKQENQPQLNDVWIDNFTKNSLTKYTIEGNAKWEQGHLLLGEGSSIGVQIEVGKRANFSFSLATAGETEHQTLIILTLQDGNILLMDLHEVHSKINNGTAISLELVSEQDGELIRDSIKEEMSEEKLFNGEWDLRLDHGYVQLFRNEQMILSAYSLLLDTTVTELNISQFNGLAKVDSLGLKTGSISKPLTNDQKIALANAEKKLDEGIRFYNLGQQEEAMESIEDGFNLIKESFDQQHEFYLYFLEKLIAISSTQDKERAKTLRENACELAKQILGTQHPGYAQQIHELASLNYLSGEYERAVELLQISRQIIKQNLGIHDPSYTVALESIEQCFRDLEDYPNAEKSLIELLSLNNEIFGAESDESSRIMLRLGNCCYYQGRESEAESYFLRVKSIRRQSFNGGFFGFAGVDDEDNGILVSSIEDDSPSAIAGLKPGDVIFGIGQYTIGQWSDLSNVSGNLQPGVSLTLKFKRHDELFETNLIVGEHPLHDEANQRLADFYTRLNNYKAAEPLMVEMANLSQAVEGPKSAEYARAIKNLSNLYSRMLQHKKSQQMCLEWCAIKEDALGNNPTVDELVEYSKILNRLGLASKRINEFDLSLSAFSEAASIMLELNGDEDPEFVACLQNLGNLHMAARDFEKSIAFFKRAILIQEKNKNLKSKAYADSLSGLANVLMESGDLEQAKNYISQSLDILGDDHSGFELGLLANIHLIQGNYDEAKMLGQKAWAKAKQKIGPKDPDYSTRLHDLAIIYLTTGDFKLAEPLLQKSLESAKSVLGDKSDVFAVVQGTFGNFYRGQGDYPRALTFLQQASDILENGDPIHYSNTLNNMAMTYIAMGNLRKASTLFEQSAEIRKLLFGADHPSYSMAANNSALIFQLTGQLDLGRKYLQQAADIKKRSFGKEHPSYALSLNNLANNSRLRGDHAEAIRLFTETVKIVKASLGDEHPTYATCLFNLGLSYLTKGDYQQAERHLIESQEIRERVLGNEHPDSAVGISKLAELYWMTGNEKKASDLLRQSFERSFALATRYSTGQSRSEQLRYAVWLQESLHKLVSFELNSDSPDASVYDDILNWKGMTLIRQREYRKLAEDGESGATLASLEQVTRQLSTLLRSVPQGGGVDEWAERVAELTDERDRLEKELAQKSSGLQQTGRWLRGQDVMEQLPRDAVLVDFLCFERNHLVEEDGKTTIAKDSKIMASILRHNQETVLVDLGLETELGKAIDNWRSLLLSSDNANDSLEMAGRKIRKFLWEPLLPYLDSSQTIILSTDGVLGRVSFPALPGKEKGTYLIEDHRFTCVPVPRLLLEMAQRESNDKNVGQLLLVGDVDYDSVPRDAEGNVGSTPPEPITNRNETQYASLAQTAGEITDIRELFLGVPGKSSSSVTMLKKLAATEAAIRENAHDFRFVHFATHGFFADPAKTPLKFFGNSSDITTQADSKLNDFVEGYSPGQLSGLVLAGANWQSQGKDDGILTSDEICYLPLNNVELVVLSACETGLGPVAGGEGLLGVQRAFQVSGADSVVASLWNVDDVATRRLMVKFYQNLFVKKMKKLDALREAQLWMLKNPDSIEGGIVRGDIVRLKKPAKNAKVAGQRTSPKFW